MGTTTSNIGIYIPAAGEQNYDTSFAAGMMFLDQHDHSGAPNGGVPIAASGIAAGAVTRDKLNANVVLAAGGLAVDGGSPNALKVDGILLPIFQLASNGLVTRTSASTAAARTITGTANQVSVANGDGVSGNPTLSLPSTIYTNISFDAGDNTLSSYTTGTFVPTITFAAGTVTSYAEQKGKYWKIGSVVYFTVDVLINVFGAPTGSAKVSGLPFTAANDTYNNILSVNPLVNFGANYTMITAEVIPNTTTIQLIGCGTNGVTNYRQDLDDTNFSNTTGVKVTGFYWTA